MRSLALVSMLALLGVGCLGSDFADSIQGPWEMTSGSVDGETIPLVQSHPVTINFDDGDVTGTASCNGYGGTYELNGSSIDMGSLAMTEMACFPDETMTAEQMFAVAITRVDLVSLDSHLTLSGEGVELTFEAIEPVPTSDLTNTVWVLDSLIDGEAVSSVEGERATLELFTDGSILGGTGCRLLTGHYEIEGAEVLFTEFSAKGECPSELTAQDGHVVTVLGDGFRAEIEGRRLTLWSVGDLGLVYTADA